MMATLIVSLLISHLSHSILMATVHSGQTLFISSLHSPLSTTYLFFSDPQLCLFYSHLCNTNSRFLLHKRNSKQKEQVWNVPLEQEIWTEFSIVMALFQKYDGLHMERPLRSHIRCENYFPSGNNVTTIPESFITGQLLMLEISIGQDFTGPSTFVPICSQHNTIRPQTKPH